jgi:CO/xanthine dehydrogenase Mo-binding subunit
MRQYTAHDDELHAVRGQPEPARRALLMTAFVLGLPEHKVRVIAPDVGGGFGSKIFLYAEECAGDLGQQAAQPAHQVDGRAQREPS